MLEGMERIEEYDPQVYGELKAEFLKKLGSILRTNVETEIIDQEEMRQGLIKDIREGRLGVKE